MVLNRGGLLIKVKINGIAIIGTQTSGWDKVFEYRWSVVIRTGSTVKIRLFNLSAFTWSQRTIKLHILACDQILLYNLYMVEVTTDSIPDRTH